MATSKEMMDQLIQYVQPTGPLPPCFNTKAGRLLLVGSAVGVWDDLQRVGHDFIGDRGAINDMIAYYPDRLDYGFSLHVDKLPFFTFLQYLEGAHKGWKPLINHSTQAHSHCQVVWHIHRDGGTSGLFAVLCGLLMGYDEIILAGIPCDDSPRFFDPPGKRHEAFGRETVWDEWLRAKNAVFDGKVKSLSGNTRTWLGEP